MKLKEKIDAEAGLATHARTGFMLEACIDDAKMRHGLWQPEDTFPIVARYWAKSFPRLANLWIKIYLAMNGQKEVSQ